MLAWLQLSLRRLQVKTDRLEDPEASPRSCLDPAASAHCPHYPPPNLHLPPPPPRQLQPMVADTKSGSAPGFCLLKGRFLGHVSLFFNNKKFQHCQ